MFALVLLTSLVFLDLSIPRLVQRIIDQGITAHNQNVVMQTALLTIGISIIITLIAVGNNILSVQVGESMARDLRDGLFTHIQTFSYGNLDEQKTGQLMMRLTSDTSAVQRVAQISLCIGTCAPLIMIGSLILMINTIRDADQVLVINNGEIVEKGTHKQLLDAHGFYQPLYISQFKGQAI